MALIIRRVWAFNSSTDFPLSSDPVDAVTASAGLSVALPDRAMLEMCGGRDADGVQGVLSGEHPRTSGRPDA